MDILKKYFPRAFKANDVSDLVVALIIYLAIGIIGGAIIGVLCKIAIIGIIFTIVGAIIDLYALIGIILSILVFLDVIK